MTVHRTRLLPIAPARGRLVVPETVLAHTADALRRAGARQPPQERLVWLMGRQVGEDTVVVACHAPPADSGPGHVIADERVVGAAARLARGFRLGIVGQVHSHPGHDTRHSDGDDQLVLLPFAGMFSLVVARYGAGSLDPEGGAGLHQFQDGRWVRVDPVGGVLTVVPALLPQSETA